MMNAPASTLTLPRTLQPKERSSRRWYPLYNVLTLLFQLGIAFTLFAMIDVSENGAYEFPFMAERSNLKILLLGLGCFSLLTGILSTWFTLRHHRSLSKWLWILLCSFPALFMGCLYIHFLLIMEALA
jgi:uncharacterized membrane protein HdeD (DUF308 family)